MDVHSQGPSLWLFPIPFVISHGFKYPLSQKKKIKEKKERLRITMLRQDEKAQHNQNSNP